MIPEIQNLIEISRHYGINKDCVIAGGGNTSFKNNDHIWVKASGTTLADITEEGFVILDRKKLDRIPNNTYDNDPSVREQQVKEALYASCISADHTLRPSVETSLHNAIEYSYVVHLHPTLVNALLCGNNSLTETHKLFKEALYIPYTDPGYTLFVKVLQQIQGYRITYQCDPKIIFLENHGVFVSADTTEEIHEIYSKIFNLLETHSGQSLEISDLPIPDAITECIPAIRMLFSDDGLKTCSLKHNSLIAGFYKDRKSFAGVSAPFTPDTIVYCKSNYLYIDSSDTPESIITSVSKQLPDFVDKYGYKPKIVVIKNYGLLAIDDTWQGANTCLEVFEDHMKVSFFSDGFGGPRFMNAEQIAFIDNWEVEHYRRKVAKGSGSQGKVLGKTAVVTGGAMGFGAGLVQSLLEQGANVVIADLNLDAGKELATKLSEGKKNKALCFQTDVGSPESIQNTIQSTVEHFGGIDLFVSNAGILFAGSLEEMEPKTFELMTKVNYNAFFYGTKYASAVMKLQQQYKSDHYTDIIQINSKSGLAGSNKNFAYAGGKFGGIGLTQSFALELMPFKIKVNAICPGNFFEGPLWSDPDKGLFVQYLNTGKVPGAKTIEEVKAHYENQVPARRGCRVEDVARALYYLIEQEYETGQALPVTGGQIMLH